MLALSGNCALIGSCKNACEIWEWETVEIMAVRLKNWCMIVEPWWIGNAKIIWKSDGCDLKMNDSPMILPIHSRVKLILK